MADDVLVGKVFNFICGNGGFVELSVLLRHRSPLGRSNTKIEARKWLMTRSGKAGCSFVAVKNCEDEIAGVRIDLRKKICHEYCYKGTCEKERGKCEFWHICKGFLEGSCSGKCCRSHDFFNIDNKAKTKHSGVERFSNGTVRNAVAWSLPQVCRLYLINECKSDNCPYLHICSHFVRGSACDCVLSHSLADQHNYTVLGQYNMVPDHLMKPEFLCCNILVQIRQEQRAFHSSKCECDRQATNEGISQLGNSVTTGILQPSEKLSFSPEYITVEGQCDQETSSWSSSNVTISGQTNYEGVCKVRMERTNDTRKHHTPKRFLDEKPTPATENSSFAFPLQPPEKSLVECLRSEDKLDDTCLRMNTSAGVLQEFKTSEESKNMKQGVCDAQTHYLPQKNSLEDRNTITQQESEKTVSICELDLTDEDKAIGLRSNKKSSESKQQSAKREPGISKTPSQSSEGDGKVTGGNRAKGTRKTKSWNKIQRRNSEHQNCVERQPRISIMAPKCSQDVGAKSGDGSKDSRRIRMTNEFQQGNFKDSNCMTRKPHMENIASGSLACVSKANTVEMQNDQEALQTCKRPLQKRFQNPSALKRRQDKFKRTPRDSDSAIKVQVEKVKSESEHGCLPGELSNKEIWAGNDSKGRPKGSEMTAQILDTAAVMKVQELKQDRESAKTNSEPKPKKNTKRSKITKQNTVSASEPGQSNRKIFPKHDAKKRTNGSMLTAHSLDTAGTRNVEELKQDVESAKANNESIPNHIQTKSVQGCKMTKENTESACKPGQSSKKMLPGNDSKRSSDYAAAGTVKELKTDFDSAKENSGPMPNYAQDEHASNNSVQRSVMTKGNLGSAWKPRFDNKVENYPGNAHSESTQKRLQTSRDTRGDSSIVTTPVKVSHTYKQTMKTTECLAPGGLMQDHSNTEAARTSMMDGGCNLQAPPSSHDMETEHHRDLSISNSFRPTSVTSHVPLKVKVFECLCKEYNCSVSFAVISKRTDLFPCRFKNTGSWFERNRNSFLITEDEQGIISEVDAYSLHARLCFNYNSVYHGSCKKKNCQYLHVCKDYITNSCSHGAICQRNHHFQDERDKALLSNVKLDVLTDEELRKLVLSSTPQVCVNYNNSICDRGNSCKRIHICSNHLKKTCREESSCGLDHESAMHTGHTQSVLKRYYLEHLDSRPLKKIILVPDCSPGKKETGHDEQNYQNTHICSNFLLGVCEKGFQCQAHHCHLPFHWQYRLTEDNEWKNFSGEDNEKLEKLFCDVTQNDCSAAGFHISCERGESILLKDVHEVRFLLDRMVMVLEDESEIIADLRRLSTDSYVTDRGSTMATRWIWYWKESDDIWRVYDQDNGARDLQRSLEEAFLKSRNRFRFRLAGQDYALSFLPTFEMNETSLKYGTARKVRRRPEKMLSKDDIQGLKRSHISLPLCWRNKTKRASMPRNWSAVPSDRQYKRIPLPQHSAEFREMEKVFSKSIKCSVVITNIEKVQVPLMWKKYQRGKGKMSVAKAGNSKRKFLTEKQLAHGTRTGNGKTCKQNVNWCVACKYVCTFSRKEHQRVRRRKLLRLDFLSE